SSEPHAANQANPNPSPSVQRMTARYQARASRTKEDKPRTLRVLEASDGRLIRPEGTTNTIPHGFARGLLGFARPDHHHPRLPHRRDCEAPAHGHVQASSSQKPWLFQPAAVD